MGTEYLIDTNTIIDFSAEKLPAKSYLIIADIIDDSPKIYVITKIELLAFKQVSEQIKEFTENAFVAGLDDEIVDQTIALRKEYKIKIPNAIIAPPALILGF